MHLFLPIRTHLQYPSVNLHSSFFVVSHNHRLTCQFILAVLLVVLHDILTKTVYRIRMTQYLLQSAILLTGFVYLLFGSTLICQAVKFFVQFPQGLFIQVQLDDTTLIIHFLRSSVCHCLRHVIDVDIVSEHLLRIAVALGDGCTRKPDKRGIGQCFTHQQRKAFFHLLGLRVPMLVAILRTVSLIGYHDDVLSIG